MTLAGVEFDFHQRRLWVFLCCQEISQPSNIDLEHPYSMLKNALRAQIVVFKIRQNITGLKRKRLKLVDGNEAEIGLRVIRE